MAVLDITSRSKAAFEEETADVKVTDQGAEGVIQHVRQDHDVASASNPGDVVTNVTSGAAVTVLASDATRKAASLTPDQDVYYSLGGTPSSSTPRLYAGQPLQFPIGGVNYTGEVKMIAVSTTANVSRWTL